MLASLGLNSNLLIQSSRNVEKQLDGRRQNYATENRTQHKFRVRKRRFLYISYQGFTYLIYSAYYCSIFEIAIGVEVNAKLLTRRLELTLLIPTINCELFSSLNIFYLIHSRLWGRYRCLLCCRKLEHKFQKLSQRLQPPLNPKSSILYKVVSPGLPQSGAPGSKACL